MTAEVSVMVGVLHDEQQAIAAPCTRHGVEIDPRLVHEYPQIDDEAVYSIAQRDAPVLRAACAALLRQAGDVD